MPIASRSFRALVVVGLLLRLCGIVFNGQLDLYEMILVWGQDVRTLGLVQGFSVNYGLFSFALFGVAAYFGEMIARFWWLPYKVIAIAFEAGVFAALLRFSPPQARSVVLLAFWLNPWFIVHVGFQGFWEGPHVLFALVGVLVLRCWAGTAAAWVICGIFLFMSAEFKPHGLIHFAGPLGILLVVWFVRRARTPLIWFAAGFGGAALAVTFAFAAAGGSSLALLFNLRSAVEAMPVVSAGGLGLWRFVSFGIMRALDLRGEVHELRLPPTTLAWLTLFAATTCLALLVTFAWRVGRQSRLPRAAWVDAYLMITFGALVMSQLGLQAHLNHTYGAMALLIPFLPANRRLRAAWIAAAIVQGFAHLTRYGLGNPQLLPADSWVERFAQHGPIVARVRALPAFTEPDGLLRFQAGAADLLGRLATHEAVSVLGLAMVGATLVMLWALFEMAVRTDPFEQPR